MKKIDLKLMPNKNVFELLKVPSYPKSTLQKFSPNLTQLYFNRINRASKRNKGHGSN